MSSKVRWSGLVLAIGIQAVGALGCGSSSDNSPSGDGGTGGSSSGTGGSGGYVPPGEGGTVTDTLLGATCATNTDCGTGLTCAKPTDDLLGGGPANGYCTRNCTTNGDCIPYGGACVGDGMSQSICLLACTTGMGDLSTKCSGRRDLACEALQDSTGAQSTSGACFPFCASDAECGTRKCNLGTGACVDTVPAGLPIGSSCTANMMPDPCLGVCVPLADGTGPVPGLCTAPCRFGRIDLQGCGYRVGALDASATTTAACAIPSASDGYFGDIGLCLQLCDTDQDCLATDFICDLGAVADWQHGACFPKAPADGGVPDGGVPSNEAGTPAPEAGSPPSDAGAPSTD